MLPRSDGDHVAVPHLKGRPQCTRDAAVMINRLAVRADQVDFRRRDRCILERRQEGFGKRLADADVQLGDAANIEFGGRVDAPLQLGIVRVLVETQ